MIDDAVLSFAGSEWALWLLSVGALAILAYGADRAVQGAAALATVLGMSPVIIGATVVSLGTTSPEACVSVMAALRGNAGLALGNGIGSIICDTGMIFGVSCLIGTIPLDRRLLNRQGRVQLGAGLLLAMVVLVLWIGAGCRLQDVVIPRAVGGVFLALLIGYMAVSIRWAREHPHPVERNEANRRSAGVGVILRNLVWVVVGIAMVVFASRMLIVSAIQICRNHRVPETVIAGTFVAFGTSLPELVTAVTAVLKKQGGLAVGNVIGADILNVLFVVGASAAARPLQVDAATFYLMLPAMVILLLVFRSYVVFTRGKTFRPWQGLPLLLIYSAFVVLSVWLFGVQHWGS